MAPRKTCPAMQIFSFLSRRWTLLVIHALNNGQNTFNAMKRELGSISSRTLSERLKDLEMMKFVERKIVSEQPLKIEYQLTPRAQSFETHLSNIGNWAKEWDGK